MTIFSNLLSSFDTMDRSWSVIRPVPLRFEATATASEIGLLGVMASFVTLAPPQLPPPPPPIDLFLGFELGLGFEIGLARAPRSGVPFAAPELLSASSMLAPRTSLPAVGVTWSAVPAGPPQGFFRSDGASPGGVADEECAADEDCTDDDVPAADKECAGDGNRGVDAESKACSFACYGTSGEGTGGPEFEYDDEESNDQAGETAAESLRESDSDTQTAAAILLALKWLREKERVSAEPLRRAKRRALASEEYRCGRCGTTKTPLWRKTPGTDTKLCNACGIYFKTHGKQRPAKWFRMN